MSLSYGLQGKGKDAVEIVMVMEDWDSMAGALCSHNLASHDHPK